MKYIIALMGPSQSGKTFVIKKILSNACRGFSPELVAKQTTRPLRREEEEALARGEKIDVEHVDKITADLVYQTYGKRTGVEINKLIEIANAGKVPVVVINDIMAMAKLKKECQRRDSDICVLSIFLFRRIPVEKEYLEESEKRGNVDPKETMQRFRKAETVYRIYIENMHMFDYVMLNTVTYDVKEINNQNTIIDSQIVAIRDNVILKGIRPNIRKSKGESILYIISGNGGSGKDELIEATNAMGKLYASVMPKYTSRNQQSMDGNELICKMNIVDKNQKPVEYQLNRQYNDYLKLREKFPDRYLTYYSNGGMFEYAIDMEQLRKTLNSGCSMVMALSDIETIAELKREFGDRVVALYCNSQISKEELREKSSDSEEIILAKLKDYEKKLNEFIANYMEYRHVILYAENQYNVESGASKEGLIDQLFRLFRAYEEQWI